MEQSNGGRKRRPGPVVIERELITSKAFLSLQRKASPQVLLLFLARRQMAKIKLGKREAWTCTNNGQIEFTYKEAKEKYGFGARVFSRVIGELVDRGFLDVEQPGSIGRRKTLYTISDRWVAYGTEQFERESRLKPAMYKFPRGVSNPRHRKNRVKTVRSDS